MTVPICVVSNGPVSKMQHSLGKRDVAPLPGKTVQRLRYQRWKPTRH
jgi:beta-phosphoglucomutase-like phosphatase (HAD superfamily)